MRLRKIVACLLAVLMLVAATPAFDLSALAAYDMPYYIEVDLTNQIVTIYSTGTDVIVRQMLCSTGVKNATPKPRKSTSAWNSFPSRFSERRSAPALRS